MMIDIDKVRPRVISDELAAELDEYLSFRYIFRNIYGFELKGDRLNILVKKFDKIGKQFRKEINAFLRKMKNE